MKDEQHTHYHIYYGRGWTPITKFDATLARVCIAMVKFWVLLFFAFAIFLMILL